MKLVCRQVFIALLPGIFSLDDRVINLLVHPCCILAAQLIVKHLINKPFLKIKDNLTILFVFGYG